MLDNYEVILGVWEEFKNSQIDNEMKAKIIGIETQMLTFNFLFGISLGTLILQHRDNLSKSLQHDIITAAERQQLAKLTIDLLKSICKEDKFKSFGVLLHQSEFDIRAPTISRKRRACRRLQIGLTVGNFHSKPENNYRQIYYEALDLVIESITSRVNQPGYKVYRNVKDLVLMRGYPYDTELSNVCHFYKEDISKMQLQAQLRGLFAEEKNQSELSINDIIKSLPQLSSAQRLAFSNVWVPMKILLEMPTTNASLERSFSRL